METVEAVSAALGGVGTGTIRTFESSGTCAGAKPSQWVDAPGSDHLWATARDGEVVLTTTSNGEFAKE